MIGLPDPWILTASWPRYVISKDLVAPFLVCNTFRLSGSVQVIFKEVHLASFLACFLHFQYMHIIKIARCNTPDPIPPPRCKSKIYTLTMFCKVTSLYLRNVNWNTLNSWKDILMFNLLINCLWYVHFITT